MVEYWGSAPSPTRLIGYLGIYFSVKLNIASYEASVSNRILGLYFYLITSEVIYWGVHPQAPVIL